MLFFQEIDHRSLSRENTIEGVVQLHAAMARLRVQIYFSGLDAEFDQARGAILRKEPKQDLESSYAYVRRESQQKKTMGGSRLISENSAIVAHRPRVGTSPGPFKTRSNQQGKSFSLVCTHCGETGHSK